MTLELPLAEAAARGWVELPFIRPAWITIATTGDARDPEVRAHALRSMGLDPARVCMVRQVHSRTVRCAEALLEAGSTATSEHRLPGDGIICGPNGPPLAVGVGDCVPILIADRTTGAYAILHSGWRGTGILAEAAVAMHERFGSQTADLVVLIGPCISARAYDVDEERARAYAVWGPDAVVRRDDRAYLDMRAANLAIARRLGIDAVTVVDHCTVGTPELGSFRREGAAYTGMLAVIAAG